MRILVIARSNPANTAHYYAKAFRQLGHEVRNCGPAFGGEEALRWRLWEASHWGKYDSHEAIDLLERRTVLSDYEEPELLHQLDDWEPELVVWIDTGWFPDLLSWDCPVVCILGDTHIDAVSRQAFVGTNTVDHLYLQFCHHHLSDYPGARWLPAAADPEVWQPYEVEACYDIVFVGQTHPEFHPFRVQLLQHLSETYAVWCTTKHGAEAAMAYSRGFVGFNCSHSGDFNMRNIEVLSCGLPLMTSNSSWTPEGFPGVVYHGGSPDLDQAFRSALDCPSARDWILEYHTYTHRASQVLEECLT